MITEATVIWPATAMKYSAVQLVRRGEQMLGNLTILPLWISIELVTDGVAAEIVCSERNPTPS